MKKEMKLNQEIFMAGLNIQPTDTALFINGLFFDLEAIDVLTLLESLRSELRVMEALHKIGMSYIFVYIFIEMLNILYYLLLYHQIKNYISLQIIAGFSNKKMSKLLALDLSGGTDNQNFAMDIRDSAINWINDIENDSRYNKWSRSLTELLRPTFPGMLRNIRRNLYNLVSIVRFLKC